MVLDNFCNYLEHKEVQFYFMFKVDLNILNKIIKLVKEFLKKYFHYFWVEKGFWSTT